jgi:hypothetical protein
MYPLNTRAQESLISSTVSALIHDVARPETLVSIRIYGEVLISNINCAFDAKKHFVELQNIEKSETVFLINFANYKFKFEKDRFPKGKYLLKIKSDNTKKIIFKKELSIVKSGSFDIYAEVCGGS